MFPNDYASPEDLPFNASCLKAAFRLSSPDAGPESSDNGVRVILHGTNLLLQARDNTLQLPGGPLPKQLAPPHPPLFIGTWKKQPCYAQILPEETPLPKGYQWVNILGDAPPIGIDLLSLAGVAGQMLHWERSSRYCSRCGGAMDRLTGEWGKKCRACGYDHFPHIHPCVIVIVRRPGAILMTRKAQWPAGRYSLVAGFLDFGECLEEAVAREVLEETGVTITNIRYVGSQSWPFPSQLMAGFIADYVEGNVVVEEKELEDARWFPTTALPSLPPRRSIARYLIDHFATEPQENRSPGDT